MYRKGYVAQGAEPLIEAIKASHRNIFNENPKKAPVSVSSMWRDLNVFNEVGIPSVTYGPSRDPAEEGNAMKVKDLVNAAKVYALITMAVCSRV